MFITLEGPEGSGKTTHAPLLAQFLRQLGYTVFTTREPGGTQISDQIREVLTRLDNEGMNPRTELLLFCAARAQLVEQVIRPRIAQGEIVISDRYADSTLAYQGYGHGLDIDFLHRLLSFATGNLKPDLTVLLDVDAEVGLSRKQKEGEWNRLDAYAVAFHQRVRAGYLEMAKAESERWQIIDAGQSYQEVQTALFKLVASKIK
ncbi:MAG: dTMP kinase [Anaerolineaceae bacterium]|nr:dTMP kinase [Anaerolineaceae bacterium]